MEPSASSTSLFLEHKMVAIEQRERSEERSKSKPKHKSLSAILPED
jgi:hypothetical protein